MSGRAPGVPALVADFGALNVAGVAGGHRTGQSAVYYDTHDDPGAAPPRRGADTESRRSVV